MRKYFDTIRECPLSSVYFATQMNFTSMAYNAIVPPTLTYFVDEHPEMM